MCRTWSLERRGVARIAALPRRSFIRLPVLPAERAYVSS
jgi:hypothetical protein